MTVPMRLGAAAESTKAMWQNTVHRWTNCHDSNTLAAQRGIVVHGVVVGDGSNPNTRKIRTQRQNGVTGYPPL